MSGIRIGVVGAAGDIGRAIPAALASLLADQGAGSPDMGPLTLVLAGRHRDTIAAAPAAVPAHVRVERTRLDVRDRDSLAGFAAGVDLVVNATGPSHDLAAGTAAVVLGAGADLVDVGGPADPADLGELDHPAGRTALVHAGALPGAAGLLPRWLLRRNPTARTVTVVTGGRGAFTTAGAVDYLVGTTAGDVEPLAAWRGGRRVARAAERRIGVDLPEFPDPVTLFPYLDTDAEDIARAAHVVDGTWYSAMVGDGIADTFVLATGLGPQEGALWLRDASVAALAGRRPYVVVLVDVDGQRAMLRAPGEAALAAEVAAAAAVEVLGGRVPTGVHTAAGALDVDRVVAALARPGGRCTLTRKAAQDLDDDLMAEGVL